MDMGSISYTFTQTGDFEAVDTAELYLSNRGFSVGSMQAGSPRGILYGDYDIAKWRNLTPEQRAGLDGHMVGGRSGPVVITIFENASSFARRAATPPEAALARGEGK